MIILFMWNPLTIKSQDVSQILRGRVVEKTSFRAIPGAQITLTGESTGHVTITDTNGFYEAAVAPGKYLLSATAKGYKKLSRENVMVYSARQQVEDLELEQAELQIDSVVVTTDADTRAVGIDQWNVQHFAAVFYDPARVVNAHAGAINMDDGTNHFTVRGSSSNYVSWKLEQVEVVNPNHLENGGTQNDRPAMNGGGVSMISAQLIQRSAFYFAPFHGMQGNALTGIFDMNLRAGNNQKPQHTIQASLLGIDLCTEGPLTKGKSSSYLVNFRYSTIGLLTKMGVNFGDEQSTFGDLSHLLYLPYKKGLVKVFGINGMSQTLFNGKRDSALVEIQKELQDISYASKTFINGFSVLSRLGNGAYLKNVIVYSDKTTGRDALPLYAGTWHMPPEHDRIRQGKLTALSYLSGELGHTFTVKGGAYFTYNRNSIVTGVPGQAETGGTIDDPLIQPFLSVDGSVGRRLGISAALHGFYLTRIGYAQLQPRAEMRYDIGKRNLLTASYGLSAQLQNPMLYLGNQLNSTLLPTSCQAFAVGHQLKMARGKIRSEIYHQLFTDIPNDSATGFSAFNYFNETVVFPLQQDGKARITGLDTRVEFNPQPLYSIFSASIYKSIFSAHGEPDRPARFSTGYNIFLCAGREQRIRSGNRWWSVDLRGTYRNGFFERDLSAADHFYNRRLPRYWRADLRLSYKKNRSGKTAIWALDLQNVTARKNTAYHYFDKVTQQEETKYHLGLIPVLSYKVMF